MLDYRDSEATSAVNISIKFINTTFEPAPGFPTPPGFVIGSSVIIWLLSDGATSIQSYKYRLQEGATVIVPVTTTTSPIFTIGGLTKGKTYTVFAESFTGLNGSGDSGGLVSRTFTFPSDSASASLIETILGAAVSLDSRFENIDNSAVQYYGAPGTKTSSTTGLGNQTIDINYVKTSKSLFKLSQNIQNSKINNVAYKSFSQINTTQSYYAFGTTLFFDATINKPIQSGGFSFFTSNNGLDGYFLKIQTTASSAAESGKEEFKIYRVKGGVTTRLQDSQKVPATTLKGIYGGRAYKIDVKVAQDNSQRIITAYVNGFKITATDSDTTLMLPVTSTVAMICNYGDIYFDYVYGMTIDLESYNKDYLFNVYEGHYPQNLISFLYGEKVSTNDPGTSIVNNGFIEEFGAVARELRVLKTKYESRPAFPLYASTGINPFVKIIGQRLTSSGAEVYVLNNSGTYIPLDDSEYYSFYILGKYISQSGDLEYTDNSASQYTSQEPVVFDSNWIQKNSDVVALGNWIKNIWSKKQMVISMSVFGNPLLSVGDIVTINYPYQGLTGSQKFIITEVNHSYKEGLETTISCRTI